MDVISGERRASVRYELPLKLRYRVLEGQKTTWKGSGQTIDISRNAIRFHASRELPVDSRLELTIDWPVRFGDIYPMELFVTGCVLRSAGGDVIADIASWQLRLSASSGKVIDEADLASGWAPRCRTRELELRAVM